MAGNGILRHTLIHASMHRPLENLISRRVQTTLFSPAKLMADDDRTRSLKNAIQ